MPLSAHRIPGVTLLFFACLAWSMQASAAGENGEPCGSMSAGPVQRGRVTSPLVNEASGMVASRARKRLLWVHNDSGDSARVFALKPGGKVAGIYQLDGVEARDWEDMAAGPCPWGGDCLWLGDIGDNFALRDWILIHAVEEPKPGHGTGRARRLGGVRTWRLTYEGGARDAETLIVDPVEGHLVVVTKAGEIYAADPGSQAGGGDLTLERKGAIRFERTGERGSDKATAGDVDARGRIVAVRTYTHLYLWERGEGAPLWEAFEGRPCRIRLRQERQGETLALTPDGRGLYTLSEGTGQPIWAYGAAAW